MDEFIDDAFCVKKAKFLWQSFDKENNSLVSALTEQQCIAGTRFYLKGKQEGWPEEATKYDGEVEGKLWNAPWNCMLQVKSSKRYVRQEITLTQDRLH